MSERISAGDIILSEAYKNARSGIARDLYIAATHLVDACYPDCEYYSHNFCGDSVWTVPIPGVNYKVYYIAKTGEIQFKD